MQPHLWVTAALIWAAPATPMTATPVNASAVISDAMPYGVDVSNHDAGFDWSQEGLAFGIAKASEGTGFADQTFARNWQQLKANGLVRGAYHFGRPGADPVKQADHFLGVVQKQGLERGDLLVLDLEVTDGRSTAQVNAWAKRWLERVHDATGVRPLFYSSWSFARQHGSGLGAYPLWVAHYGQDKGEVAAPAPWKDWVLHQYSSTDHDNNVAGVSVDRLRELGYR